VSFRSLFQVAALSFASAYPAMAQVLPPERGMPERPTLPEFFKPAPIPGLQLPPAPVVPEGRLSAGTRIVVKRFRITGATVFPYAELEKLLEPWTGRPIGNDELEEARLALTRHYIAAGYVNSGAVIPDQKIEAGVVEIHVVEGRLSSIVVGGENKFRPWYITGRIDPGAGPLNVNKLQERMQILLQNPMIERINAELTPGLEPGEANLRLDVTEGKRFSVDAQYANNRSPAIGENRLELAYGMRNVLGLGETFGLRVGGTPGAEDWLASFVVPVTTRDTLLRMKVEDNKSKAIEPPFDRAGIANRSRLIEVGLSHPVLRTLSQELALGAALTRQENASFLLGQPFPFVPGTPDGHTTVSALRLGADWTERSAQSVFAARVVASQGIDAFGSTVSPGFPDSKFQTLLAQMQWARRFGDKGQLIVRADLQRASEPLLPSEKLGIGGVSTVRGYRENVMVKDNGEIFSVEYRLPVGKFAPFALDLGPDEGQLELAAFFDAAHGKDENESGIGPRTLRSFGPGLRWVPVHGTLVQIYKGFALEKRPVLEPKLPDRGIHFLFALQVKF
jgi:hemolysin activation/secretion protein